MGKQFQHLEDAHIDFIGRQKIFFVASAPPQGRINVSPKGMGTFRVLGPKRAAYLDVTGSGNETAAHLAASADRRLTIMFCAFDGPPVILRLYGQATAHLRGTAGYSAQLPLFGDELPGSRQIVSLDIDLVQTSCGMAVPLFEHKADRDNLNRWAVGQGKEGLRKYWRLKNVSSIDGLPTGIEPDTMADA
jgi:pyridoxamine 5'-phosphate oxidase-like protein